MLADVHLRLRVWNYRLKLDAMILSINLLHQGGFWPSRGGGPGATRSGCREHSELTGLCTI